MWSRMVLWYLEWMWSMWTCQPQSSSMLVDSLCSHLPLMQTWRHTWRRWQMWKMFQILHLLFGSWFGFSMRCLLQLHLLQYWQLHRRCQWVQRRLETYTMDWWQNRNSLGTYHKQRTTSHLRYIQTLIISSYHISQNQIFKFYWFDRAKSILYQKIKYDNS